MRSGEKTSARVKFAYRFHLKSNKSHAASSGHTARERWKWEKRRKQIRKIGTSFSDGKISLMSSKKRWNGAAAELYGLQVVERKRGRAKCCKRNSINFPFIWFTALRSFILFAQRWRGEFSSRPLICSLLCGESADGRTFSICLLNRWNRC